MDSRLRRCPRVYSRPSCSTCPPAANARPGTVGRDLVADLRPHHVPHHDFEDRDLPPPVARDIDGDVAALIGELPELRVLPKIAHGGDRQDEDGLAVVPSFLDAIFLNAEGKREMLFSLRWIFGSEDRTDQSVVLSAGCGSGMEGYLGRWLNDSVQRGWVFCRIP
ncbi:hypothetical protein ACLOJK_016185 [Asimina triloba]